MITDAITITQTRTRFLNWSLHSLRPESHTVYLTSSIAGTTPQPSDFVAPGQNFTTFLANGLPM